MVRYDLNLFEVWKPIPGYEGMYDASTEGRIWSHNTNRILKQTPNQKGYYRVRLKDSLMSVARLVCMTFNQNPDGSRGDKQRETCYDKGLWNPNYAGLNEKDRRRQYKQDHKEKVKEYKKKDYLKNREHYLAYYKQYYQNKKKIV